VNAIIFHCIAKSIILPIHFNTPNWAILLQSSAHRAYFMHH
jgi:hypothetical protein